MTVLGTQICRSIASGKKLRFDRTQALESWFDVRSLNMVQPTLCLQLNTETNKTSIRATVKPPRRINDLHSSYLPLVWLRPHNIYCICVFNAVCFERRNSRSGGSLGWLSASLSTWMPQLNTLHNCLYIVLKLLQPVAEENSHSTCCWWFWYVTYRVNLMHACHTCVQLSNDWEYGN
jgi:hypothetical protein